MNRSSRASEASVAIPARLPRSPRRPRNDDIRVCYLIDVAPDSFTGGGQVHLANLVRQMQIQNSEFRIQNCVFGGPSAHVLIRGLWSFWVIPQVIFYHFFRQKFSLIHAHSLPAMAAGKVISLILRIPIVVTIHGNLISDRETSDRTAKGLSVELARFLEKRILTKIQYNAQITVSRNFLEVPNVNKNIVYIPNGVNAGAFQGLSLPRQGEPLPDKKILFVGRKNDPVKGFRVLEEAMKPVGKEIPNAKLLVADGSISRDEVIKMYRRADLFVLPSLSEGFPLTLLEAWAAKLPVVATAVGEVSHLIKDGVNGYTVEPGNAEKLAKKIIIALKNPELAKLAENGYNSIGKFDWGKIAKSTFKVYQSVLSTH